MKDDKLKDLLERIHAEIDRTENVDAKGKRLLTGTKQDVRTLLDQSGQPADSHGSTTERLEETISHLEASHPDLTLMLTELLNILSNAGV
jgi:hypothetical protein